MLCCGVGAIVGPFYSYDVPEGSQLALREAFGVVASTNGGSSAVQNATFADFNERFQLLYTYYSVPNVVLPALGGVFVDRLDTLLHILWLMWWCGGTHHAWPSCCPSSR